MSAGPGPARPARPAPLYTPAMLALAMRLADHPFDRAAPLVGTARSRACGSEVRLSASCDDAGRLGTIGLAVTACAVAQAASAIFAAHAVGQDRANLDATAEAIARWLGGDGAPPALAEIALLEPARAHPARHAAILLPWRAAADALSKARAPG